MQATEFEIQHKGKKITFWFPILLPVLMGFVVATAEFATGLGQTGSLALIGLELSDNYTSEDWMDLLETDLINLWAGTAKGVASTMFSVDIWALTMLYTSRTSVIRSSYAYGYPVLGVFAHFVLLLLAVGLTTLAKSSADFNQIMIILLLAATFVSLLSIIVGWIVRRGVWFHYEINDQTDANTPAK